VPVRTNAAINLSFKDIISARRGFSTLSCTMAVKFLVAMCVDGAAPSSEECSLAAGGSETRPYDSEK